MSKQYRVVGVKEAWKSSAPLISERHLEYAKELKDKYGLPLSLEEIATKWRWYSDEEYMAGWLVDSKESIERVFGVILEEISGND